MQLEELIRAVQQQLGVDVDGRAGPQTWAAIYAQLVKPKRGSVDPAKLIDTVDARSEKVIATLQPQVHAIARALVQTAAQHDIRIKLISGLRSGAEQDALYARGRSQPGPKVTNARAGYSNHNFGIAFDIGVFEGTKYLAASAKYKAVGALGMSLGLEWGGSWKTLVDQPHFQLRPAWAGGMTEKQMLAELRRRVAAGIAIYA